MAQLCSELPSHSAYCMFANMGLRMVQSIDLHRSDDPPLSDNPSIRMIREKERLYWLKMTPDPNLLAGLDSDSYCIPEGNFNLRKIGVVAALDVRLVWCYNS